MKKALCLLLTLVLIMSFSVQAFAGTAAPGLTTKEKGILSAIDSNQKGIADLSRQIWNLKEIGGSEVKSAAALEDAFEKQGFTVKRGLDAINPLTKEPYPLPTAFTATYEGKKGGPTIGIMVEYDANPNGHSCGHNLISSAGFSAALGVKEALKTTPGKVIVYGTPAEETFGAKPYILEAGYMKGIDVMFANHPFQDWCTEVKYKAMIWQTYPNMLTFTGKSSHASAAPWVGRSALDAAMIMGVGIEFMREHMLETDRAQYVILEGGKASNVVPDYVKVDLNVRADDTAEMWRLVKRADNIIKAAALMTDTKAEYTWDYPCFAATQVPELYHFTADNAAAAGLVSADKFQWNTKAGGSSDVGAVSYSMPTVQVGFPVSDSSKPANHTDEFTVAAEKDNGINNSIIAGKIMAITAYRLLTNPEEMKKVKADYLKNYSKP